MEIVKGDFVVIPGSILRDNNLSFVQKIIFSKIANLDNDQGCYAQNKTFADMVGITQDYASKVISALKRKGYIKVQLHYKPGTKIVERRVIKVDKGGIVHMSYRYSSNVPDPIVQKSEVYTNTNNKKESNIEDRHLKFSNKVYLHCGTNNKDIAKEFIDYWTEKNHSGTKMKFELEKTFEIERRISRWAKNHKDWNTNKNKEVNEFKLDSTGNAYIAYCSKCGKSDFYDKYNIRNADSTCCKTKIEPKRRTNEQEKRNRGSATGLNA
tara:strand:+ start:286 stop:1086 length:801 start_codon:yes stop_codon:yes gene_type:complete